MRFSGWVAVGILFAVLAAPLPILAGDNWPNLHGPTNNGHSDATGLPLTWSETENIVWKTPIHDLGWSSPVIWGSQIWLTTATKDGKKSYAVCIDKETGKVLHDRLLFETEKPEDTLRYNSYASPTPAIKAGRVFVSFGSYGSACLDTATGNTIWSRRDLPCNHWRGPASSPILFENLMIVHYDGFDHQYVIALDQATGETVWKTPREVEYGTTDGDVMKAFSTPVVFEIDGVQQLVSPTSKATLAYDPRTGKELWRVRYKEFSVAARPIFRDGVLYLNTGFGRANLLAVKPGRGDLTDTNIIWKQEKGVPSEPTELLIGDLLFMCHDKGTAQCLDAKTGKEVWQTRLGGDYSATPLYADGKIYFFSQQGICTVIAPEREFKKLAANKFEEGFRASPAVSGKALYLRTLTHLYRVEAK